MTRPPPALVLTRSDIRRHTTVDDYFAAVLAAFQAYAAGTVHTPFPMEIDGHGGAFHGKGASMDVGERRIAALKVNSNFPENPAKNGLPTIQGALLLFDAETGVLLSVMDSAEITLRRTAAASAVAVKYLAREDARCLLICGCGTQGYAHAEAIAPLRDFEAILAFDHDFARARSFSIAMTAKLGIPVTPVGDLQDASLEADVIVTATPAKTPFLERGDVREGAFIAAVGADNPSKNEIAPALMAQSVIITDVTDQCVVMGDTRAAIGAGVITRQNIRAELGAVVDGRVRGRNSDDEVIMFDSTGAAFQDVAAAAMILDRAISSGIGEPMTLAE